MTPNALWQVFKQTGDPNAYMLYREATGAEPPVVGGLQSFNSAMQASEPNPAPGDILPQTGID